MITFDLRTSNDLTVDELLDAANTEAVLIITRTGKEYILEAADDFEREVAELGRSARFRQFLEERRREPGRIPLDEVIKRLKPLDNA